MININLETWHKPLEPNFANDVIIVSNRKQNSYENHQNYNFCVQYDDNSFARLYNSDYKEMFKSVIIISTKKNKVEKQTCCNPSLWHTLCRQSNPEESDDRVHSNVVLSISSTDKTNTFLESTL